jgi:UDP-3-O-[3-hydroxymyristoyl] glucosamine N-acyltransferase
LAERYGGTVDEGAESLVVERICALESGGARDLCPFTSRRNAKLAQKATGAEAVLLVDEEMASLVSGGRRWVHAHAAWALAGLLADISPQLPADRRDRALVEHGAELGSDVSIGPGAIVMAGARIGASSIIEPNAVIYPRVWTGERVIVGAGAVIGRPGFGWASGPYGELRRIPQLGGVWINDDVEIGPLATVDAGTLGPTILERGVRLDAHVHVGHNVALGAGTMVAAQSGFAGSVRIGAGVRIGGQAGFADHVQVGDGAKVAAKAGVIGDIPNGATVAGYPAVSRARWWKGMARMLGARRKEK